MTKEAAIKQGLTFTGVYERSHKKDIVLARLKQYRTEGYKAYLVRVNDSPLSRGYSKGGHVYSIYIEPKYQLDEEAENRRTAMSGYAKRIETIIAEHQHRLAEEEKIYLENKNWLVKNGYPLPVI